MLRYLTAGESHGPALTGILEGLPAGIPVAQKDFQEQMEKRWAGYGRGKRRKIENDTVEVLSGIRFGKTIGTPIALLIQNRDFSNWKDEMAVFGGQPAGYAPVTTPRPGHADLPGAMKFSNCDLREIIERASARETAIRVALSVPVRRFLEELKINSVTFTRKIGNIEAKIAPDLSFDSLRKQVIQDAGMFFSPCPESSKSWIKLIDSCKKSGETLGGSAEVWLRGLPAGLGSHTQWDHRLDGRLAKKLMSIPGIKGVEIGDALEISEKFGSQCRDEISYSRETGFFRTKNLGGGLEGGITNGEILRVRVYMKPLPTIMLANTIDIQTKESVPSLKERSDTFALPAAAIVAESVVILEIASAILEKFGGDSLNEVKERFDAFFQKLRAFPG